MMKLSRILYFVLPCIFSWTIAKAQPARTWTVDASKLVADIQHTMWGIFFEDINFGADGGIYAELVKNRSFEFSSPLMGWTVKQKRFREGAVVVQNRQDAHTANPRYISVNVQQAAKGDLVLINDGFRGMGVKKDMRYFFSLLYNQPVTAQIQLHISLIDSTGNVLGDTIFIPALKDGNWHKQSASFLSHATCPKAKLRIDFVGDGYIGLDMVSLFPSDTWKGRPGGMRADMVQMLADLKPGFIRFPGGCIVEGRDLNNRYQWKKTIGPVEERQLIMNRWNVEFAHRSAPDYFQTFGLGFYEYFQLAEDIGASPLPILNCGMACQFNSAEVADMHQLDAYVQDALDLIEFANGDTTTTWGKVRASMGHPASFHLKMMGIGNENWGPQYLERLDVFTKAIKNKYPYIKLVNSSGTDPEGERFDFLNTALRKRNADLIDEHYYRRPEWFFANTGRYDHYPRNGSKVFAGEYAAHVNNATGPQDKSNWLAALAEAAFMTGMERNADVVQMASYAPLFAHAEGWQWAPDLIWTNNLSIYGTPSYYVQKLFSNNKGSKLLSINSSMGGTQGSDSLYASAVMDTASGELILKMVNASARQQDYNFVIQGIGKCKGGKLTVLQSGDLKTTNSFEQPFNLSPKESIISLQKKGLQYPAPPYSLSVMRIKYTRGS